MEPLVLDERIAAVVENLAQIALYDDLTHAYRRGPGMTRLTQELDDPCGVMVGLVDLDDFKAINDTHGHATGDATLLATADALRSVGFVLRLGGDEFICWRTPEPTDTETAFVGQIRAALARVSVHATVTGCHASRGVTLDVCLQTLDADLYRRKRGGGTLPVRHTTRDSTRGPEGLQTTRRYRVTRTNDGRVETVTHEGPKKALEALRSEKVLYGGGLFLVERDDDQNAPSHWFLAHANGTLDAI
jgi:diguanylate cyclase (GGDEF)-like protein